MKPHIIIEMPAGTLAAMTDEQFHALKSNIVAEGRWESIGEETPPIDKVRVSGGEYLSVHLPNMFIGIERDGYTHS